ncbi:MAG TPA: IS66 family insertion sequence hypothetical protein [Spirochaetia bacterium]|nr:IS66 family insertion sequence hypothetical protein [Spirochaetia bacterium]HBI36211.1 IS66 family insertion sequence hypothetical protein [Spirochaetia bacterium]
MIIDLSQVTIMLKPGRTDFRKQVNGLALIIENELKQNIFSNTIFIFYSGDCRKVKILYWDKNGFCLWQKRLEEAKFPWPDTTTQVRTISHTELRMLLFGIDFFHAHKTLNYSSVN